MGAAARGRRLDLAFADAAHGLDPRERRFAHELAFGSVRLRGRLDHVLDHHLHQGVDSVDPRLLDVLRLGAYQLLHMDGVPPYAAVSQAVEQAGRRGGGLVNAVLRAVGRSGEDPSLFPDREADPAGWLSTWGSHPRWLVERWLARWSADEVAALVDADNQVPPLTLTPLVDEAEARARLAAAGIDAEPVGLGTGSLAVPQGTDPAAALAAVPAVVQDPAAALVVRYARPDPGAWVADLCAAPGGKALALSRGAPYVLAADRSASRLRLLRENADRTGAPVRSVVARAERPPVRDAPFVLVDVPCTGTGTLRRHPDARWRLVPGDVAALAAVQERILEAAGAAVAPGGLLVYSTCTLEPEENEERVEAFLAAHPEFRMEPPEGMDTTVLDGAGRLSVLPWRTGFDGAFAARMRRRA